MADYDPTQELDPNPETFDPEKVYEVRLSEPVTLGQTTFSPQNKNTFRGDFAQANRDKITSSRVV